MELRLVMLAVEILVIGIVGIAGILWQVQLLVQNFNQLKAEAGGRGFYRLLATGCFCLVMVAGCLIYGIFAWIQGDNEFIKTFSHAIGLFLRSVLFSVLLLIKAVLAPSVVTLITIATIYFLFEYQEFRIIPLFRAIAEWVFGELSATFHAITLILGFVFFLGASVADTRPDAVQSLLHPLKSEVS